MARQLPLGTCAVALATLSAAHAQQFHQYSLDQQLRSPAPTTTIMFQLTEPMGWTISSMTINVDGTDYSATVAANHLSGSIQWDSSQAPNPSEHHAYATAVVTNPFACVRATKPTFTVDTFEHGTATTGFTMSLTAYLDGQVVLYQTSGVETCTFPFTRTA